MNKVKSRRHRKAGVCRDVTVHELLCVDCYRASLFAYATAKVAKPFLLISQAIARSDSEAKLSSVTKYRF